MIKLLLPVLCVVLCAAMMFLLGTSYVDSRVALAVTSLLTVVALQMTTNDALPEVSYLVLIDQVYVATYMFVIFGFGLVVWQTRLLDEDREEESDQLNRRAVFGGTAAYLAVIVALVLPTILGH